MNTASKQAKSLGTSIKEVHELTGTPSRTLQKWFHEKPLQFRAMCIAAVTIRQARKINQLEQQQ